MRWVEFTVLLTASLAAMLPPAAASEADPQLEDPEGDTSALGTLTGDGDLIAAWLQNETSATVNVVAKLAVVDESASFRILVSWTHFRLAEDLQDVGVRAIIEGQDRSGALVRRGPNAPSSTPFEEVAALAVDVVAGRPGLISWQVPYGAVQVTKRDRFQLFEAKTESIPRNDASLEYDRAGPSLEEYTIGSPLNGFPIPTRPADAIDASGEVPGGPGDLTGVWLDRDAAFMNLTQRFRAFDFGNFVPCTRWINNITVRAGSASGDLTSWHELVANGLGHSYIRSGGNDLPGEFLYQLGEPGYVRMQVPRASWSEGNGGSLTFATRVVCSGESGTWEDEVSTIPSRGVPSIEFGSAMVAALASLLVPGLRRRE